MYKKTLWSRLKPSWRVFLRILRCFSISWWWWAPLHTLGAAFTQKSGLWTLPMHCGSNWQQLVAGEVDGVVPPLTAEAPEQKRVFTQSESRNQGQETGTAHIMRSAAVSSAQDGQHWQTHQQG